MQSAKFQRKLIYGGVAGSARSPIGTQERLPRNFRNRILFFTGVGYFKTVQSAQEATFFRFLLINVIQIFKCWSQRMIPTRSEDIAVVSEHHGHSVGVRQLLLGERQGEAQLLCGKVDNWELRHAGVSPLFVDSNQGVTQYNVTGAGLLITDFDVWEWGDLVELTGPMKPWRQVTSGPLRSRPLSLFLLSSLSSVKPKSLSIFLRNFPY